MKLQKNRTNLIKQTIGFAGAVIAGAVALPLGAEADTHSTTSAPVEMPAATEVEMPAAPSAPASMTTTPTVEMPTVETPTVETPGTVEAPAAAELTPAEPTVETTVETTETTETTAETTPETTVEPTAETTPETTVETTTETTETTTETAESANTIVDIAASTETFSTLVSALTEAELVEVLQGEGPFTVFAPTDEAFAALPPGTLEMLLKPENREQLIQILTYHVVPGSVTSDSLTSGEVATVEGSSVDVVVSEDKVTVNEATVIQPDILASNGVIHVIDRVILPPAPAQ